MHEYLGLFVLSLKLKARMGQKELTLSGFALNSGRGADAFGLRPQLRTGSAFGLRPQLRTGSAFGLRPQLRTGADAFGLRPQLPTG